MHVLSIIQSVETDHTSEGVECTNLRDNGTAHVALMLADLDRETQRYMEYHPQKGFRDEEVGDWRARMIVSLPIADTVAYRLHKLADAFKAMDAKHGLPFYYDREMRHAESEIWSLLSIFGNVAQNPPIIPHPLDARTHDNPHLLARTPMNCAMLAALMCEVSGAGFGRLVYNDNRIINRTSDLFKALLRLARDHNNLKHVSLVTEGGVFDGLARTFNGSTNTLKVPIITRVFETPDADAYRDHPRYLQKYRELVDSGNPYETHPMPVPYYLAKAIKMVLGEGSFDWSGFERGQKVPRAKLQGPSDDGAQAMPA